MTCWVAIGPQKGFFWRGEFFGISSLHCTCTDYYRRYRCCHLVLCTRNTLRRRAGDSFHLEPLPLIRDVFFFVVNSETSRGKWGGGEVGLVEMYDDVP